MQHLSLLGLLALAAPALSRGVTKRAAVNDCLTEAGVPQLSPGSDEFKKSILPYNMRLPHTPAGLVLPETVEHVQDAVKCAVDNGVTVSARGGGHSYVGNGLGGEDGHLVIDVSKFKTVTVDKETGIATIGSGMLVGPVAVALFEQSGLAIPHSTGTRLVAQFLYAFFQGADEINVVWVSAA